MQRESLFLININLEKCVIKLLTITLMHQNLFLNAVRLKNMCDKAVNIYLSAIKYVPDHCKTEEM